MKKRIVYFLVALIFLGTGSCSDKDDGMDGNNSQLQVYGLQYSLNMGVIWQNNKNVISQTIPYTFYDTYIDSEGNEKTDKIVGFTTGDEQTESGNFMLTLYESGLVYHPDIESITGKGACICFHLASADIDRFMPGKYIYGNEKKANTFTAYSSVYYDTQQSVNPAEISKGEITIEKEGEEYHIEFRGSTTNEGEIVCRYEGPLKEVRVKQQAAASFQGISLAGLLDSVNVKVESRYFEDYTYSDVDRENGRAFLCTKTGMTSYAKDPGQESIDLALLWEKETESFVFESPIRMRKWLWHLDEFYFPCHTIYMQAPDDFTDNDFDNLEESGFDFKILEQTVKIGTRSFKPGYVFFQTGAGTKGVIHVKSFTPLGSITSEDSFQKNTYPENPTLVIDIKCPANFVDPKIR